MIAPAGMPRTGSAYLSTIQKGFPLLYVARVLGASAAKASYTLQDTAVDTLTVEGKYKGADGNAIDVEVTDATDGDNNHFNMTVFVEGATGRTEDTFENLNYSGVGADSVPALTSKLLVGAITKVASGRPDNGTYSMTGGANGTINAARYVGT